MKRYIPVIILVCASCCLAQMKTDQSAVLVDGIPKTNCEELLARTDNFGNQLQSNPMLIGIVVVYGSDARITEYPARFIYQAIIGRWGFAPRVKIFHSESPEPWRVQFWLAHSESDVKISNSQLVISSPLTITSRYYFGTESGDPCSNHISTGVARILNANPNYEAQIIIFNVPRNQRAEAAAGWLKTFREDFGITRKQLRIFFKKDHRESFIVYNSEFWIVPTQTK
ncbi:MAG: hypothetical protein ABJB40_09395 [Acidobacteriota bacterium]